MRKAEATDDLSDFFVPATRETPRSEIMIPLDALRSAPTTVGSSKEPQPDSRIASILERLDQVEALVKEAAPAILLPASSPPVDLAPVMHRLADLDRRIANVPAEVDLAPTLARIAEVERRIASQPVAGPSIGQISEMVDAAVRGLDDRIRGRADIERQHMDDRVSAVAQRITDLAARQIVAESAAEDLPQFLRRAKDATTPTPSPPAPAPMPVPAHPVDLDRVHARLDALEAALAHLRPAVTQQVSALDGRLAKIETDISARAPMASPIERIEAAARSVLSRAPSRQLVEVAHLARTGQEIPLDLMGRLGAAMGCSWEEAAVSIVRRHDRMASVAVELQIAEIDARRRFAAGEDQEKVAADTIARIAAIGG